MVERDFTKKGSMRVFPKERRDELQGYLPFFSCDTQEEVDAIIERALAVGEFVEKNGRIYETTLAIEQTLDNLDLAGERLAEIRDQLQEDGVL